MRDDTHLFVDATGHLNVPDDHATIVSAGLPNELQIQQLAYGT